MIPRLCSRSNSRYSFPFNATGTRLRGWFILPQTEHLFPNAEQLFLAAGCSPPQNLHLSTSLGLESLAFRSSFSRLFARRLVMAFVSWHLAAPRLVLQWVYCFALFPSFSRVFDNTAAPQMLRHLCKSRSGILSISSRSSRSWIPQIIRSLTNESLRSPKLQVVANNFKSVTNYSCDPHGSWIREKNLNLSTVSFFRGLQCPLNASNTCVKVLSDAGISKANVS